MKLENEMKVMLVHDEEVEKSAVCLFVGSGSLCDPQGKEEGTKKIDGLAHFCEHMLFLGTKKYPIENTYKKFVKKNGGLSNAATGEDYTYYYFDVKNDHFAEGLEILCQFFKEPLFTETCTDREMNAVDNEYKMRLSNETRALIQIEKNYMAIPGSILDRF